ncbi:MAG: hypothetical protein J6Q56_01740 [Clostridia bacterium]|nr:hypothetical protein [Clostridia bacterium]
MMKRKAYIQPELDLFNVLSAEDILAGSVGTPDDWDADNDYNEDEWGWN